MSIRKMVLFGFLLMILTVFANFFVLLRMNDVQNDLSDYQRIRFLSHEAATELRQSSDDLTRLARLYAVSRESEPDQAREYLREYQAILDIRNGKVPRPENYNKVFWDFAAVDHKNPTPDSAVKKSLLDIMKDLNFTQEELSLLDESSRRSDDLVRTEMIAMNLVDGNIGIQEKAVMKTGETPRDAAIRIMHDSQYMLNKKRIMEPINQFFYSIEKRTNDMVASGEKHSFTLITVGIITLVLLGLISILLLYLIIKFVLLNINKLSRELGVLASSGGDLTKKIGLNTKNEIGYLGGSVNDFIENIRGIIREIKEESAVVDSSLEELREGVVNINMAITDITHTTEELSASLEETARLAVDMSDSSHQMEDTTGGIVSKSEDGANTSREIQKRAKAFSDRFSGAKRDTYNIFNEIKSRLESSLKNSEKVNQISILSDSILQITSQTNLLALNAAIEAARAGDAGRGFAVVSGEIRQLAEDSKQAVNEIQSVTDSVTEAVLELSSNSNELLEFINRRVIEDYNYMVEVIGEYERDAMYLSELANNFNASTQILFSGINKINQALSRVAMSTNDSADGSRLIAEKNERIESESAGIVDQSNAVKRSFENINHQISKFTV